MNAQTERLVVQGPAGGLACAIDQPPQAPRRGVAVICHPHPLFGGTMDNKVVQTIARALQALGWTTVRFNFRGVGGSDGAWDEGLGEVDDAMAVIAAQRPAGEPLILGGFSFGGYVAAAAAARLTGAAAPQGLVLVAPATSRFPVPDVPPHTLVIHGDADEVVPLADTLAWAARQGLPVQQMPGVGHFFHGQLPALRQAIETHFA